MIHLINCRNATLLLEQHSSQAVPKGQGASLWLHLRYCAYCRRYAKQTLLIAEWAQASAAARASSDAVLSAAAKEKMRQHLAAAA